jgi:hypothetical protein
VAARLDAFDAAGNRIVSGSTYALRSMRHNRPFVDGRFEQSTSDLAPILTPFETTLRFQPTDIVVPVGGHLRLTIAGSLIVNDGLRQIDDQGFEIPEDTFLGPSEPSGVTGQVTVLHDRDHRSALRFETPGRSPDYIAPLLTP